MTLEAGSLSIHEHRRPGPRRRLIPYSALLGREGDGFKVALGALDGGRISVAAQAIGIARGALDAAIVYSWQRRQFDETIARFQAIRMMIADSATALEAAWMLVLAATWAKNRGLPVTRAAAQAKLIAAERAVEVCDRALQIHGGYVYTREFSAERRVRDVRVTTIYEGTSQEGKKIKRDARRVGNAGNCDLPAVGCSSPACTSSRTGAPRSTSTARSRGRLGSATALAIPGSSATTWLAWSEHARRSPPGSRAA